MPTISMVQRNNGFKRILILHCMTRKYIKVKHVHPIVDRKVTMGHTGNGFLWTTQIIWTQGTHPQRKTNRHWKTKMMYWTRSLFIISTIMLMTIFKIRYVSQSALVYTEACILTNKRRERKTRFYVISHFFLENCPLWSTLEHWFFGIPKRTGSKLWKR